MTPDEAERKALELAHMKFGVEVEIWEPNQGSWEDRAPMNIGTPFRKANNYRLKPKETQDAII
jgi:hypothetical protein